MLTLVIIAGAAMDATIKHLLQSNHVLLVSFGRYLFGAFGNLVARRQTSHQGDVACARTAWFVIAICAVTFFWSLKVLPLPRR